MILEMGPKVYVAGPYTKGDVALNVRAAIEAADRLLKAGFCPYLPHLTHFWHLVCPGEYEQWMNLDFQWVPTCKYLVRLPGESSGADREVKLALSFGVKVFYGVDALLDALHRGEIFVPTSISEYEDSTL